MKFYEDPFKDDLNVGMSKIPETEPHIIGAYYVFRANSNTSLQMTNAFDDDLNIILLRVAEHIKHMLVPNPCQI